MTRTVTFSLFWNDLTEEAKQMIIDCTNGKDEDVHNDSYNNWDVIPMTIFELPIEG